MTDPTPHDRRSPLEHERDLPSDSQLVALSERQTSRGFQKVCFCDHYGVDCSIQKSSLATEHAIWFGADNLGLKRFPGDYTGWHDVDLGEVFPGQTINANNRMHLTQDDVRAILPTLTHFAETGDVSAHPIPAPVSADAVPVKPLVWSPSGYHGQALIAAACGMRVFYMIDGKPGDWTLTSPGETAYVHTPGYSTRAAAQAAAQVDFNRRIRSHIGGA
ncbi:MAG: hypothetical protein Q8K20_14000 [Gemmobacter sp.]|nr:hypothetical protein [Gemmobacter sp.]